MSTGYEKVFDELDNELIQLEAKPFYDLFKKLYCPNYSLRNELEQVSRRYYKVNELINDKSQYVEKLYELSQIVSKPEFKILSLIKEMEDEKGNELPLECTVCRIITNDKYSAVVDVYKEFDLFMEQIKKDDVNSSVLENLFKRKVDCAENSRKMKRALLNRMIDIGKSLKNTIIGCEMEFFRCNAD